MSEEKVLEEENGQVNCGGSVVSDHSETEILDVVQPPLFGRGNV